MKELSLNILDIAQNSITAGASLVEITVAENQDRELLTIVVRDNGRGMPPEFLARVTDPFATTRTTRPVGLGIPLLKMAAEQSGGSLLIESEEGRGTLLTATFSLGHIDRPPMGDLRGTLITLIQGAEHADFLFTHERAGQTYVLDTRELRETLGSLPLGEPEVLAWIAGYIDENESSLGSSK